MITERQLTIMEDGASSEVKMLCEEVRRLREGIARIIAQNDHPDYENIVYDLGEVLRCRDG